MRELQFAAPQKSFTLLLPVALLFIATSALAQLSDPAVAPGLLQIGRKLTLSGTGGALFDGTLSSTNPEPDPTVGVKLYWNPSKAAFRAGYITGSEWSFPNLGQYSFASGYNAKASGASAVAMGNNATASGTNSAAIGNLVTASGANSMAIGAVASVTGSSAFGGGYYSTASGYASFAFGQGVQATGMNSVALGQSTLAGGAYAATMGLGTTANAYASLVVGMNNVMEPATPATGSGAADPLFVVGNGANTSSRSNAFVVYKNGDIKIKKVQGDISVGIFSAP